MTKKRLLLTPGIVLFLLLFNGAIRAKTVPLPKLMNPASIAADESRLYISDGTSVHIYSLTDFKLKHTFGKAGEGPQEFIIHGSFGVGIIPLKQPDILVINSQGKVSYFTKKGTFIKELKTRTAAPFTPLGDNFLGTGEIVEGKTTYQTLLLCDGQFNTIKEITRWDHPIQESKREILLVPLYSKAHTHEGKIYAPPGSDMVIDVFDGKGEKLRSMSHAYKKLKVTEEYKEKTLNFFKTDPRWRKNFQLIKSMARFPDYFHAIRYFTVNKRGIYVQTYGDKAGKSEFYIFDMKGNLLKKAYIPFEDDMGINIVPRHAIAGGNLYQLVYNDDTEHWEVHIHRLN
ncbi:MAG: hypothetical protein GY765_39715 [bacterium]|nr:hypothetical protein [bacterium]